MNKLVSEREVLSLMEVVFGVELVEASQAKKSEIMTWDSISHLELIFALEEKFDVRISEKEIAEIKDLGDILALLTSRSNV